jgi:hypothetical protein
MATITINNPPIVIASHLLPMTTSVRPTCLLLGGVHLVYW